MNNSTTTVYIIESRIAGINAPWSNEGSGDEYDSEEAAEAAMAGLEPENEDGQALEYRVVSR